MHKKIEFWRLDLFDFIALCTLIYILGFVGCELIR